MLDSLGLSINVTTIRISTCEINLSCERDITQTNTAGQIFLLPCTSFSFLTFNFTNLLFETLLNMATPCDSFKGYAACILSLPLQSVAAALPQS